MGALKRTTEMVEFREAGENITSRKLPGKTTYQAVTLEAGITYDTAFEDWANLVNDFASHSITSLGEFRKNITVDVFNEAGSEGAFVQPVPLPGSSEYQALPDLDAERERGRDHHDQARIRVVRARPGGQRDTGSRAYLSRCMHSHKIRCRCREVSRSARTLF